LENQEEKQRFRALLRNRSSMLPILFFVSCAVFAAIEPKFLRIENIINIFRNTSYLAIISAGQMLVILVGGFDISVGAVVALTSVSLALSVVYFSAVMPGAPEMALLLGCLVGMLPALAIGLANGLCVGVLKAPPFIVTIGTMSVALGLADYLCGGTPIYGLPDLFSDTIGRGRLWGVPVVIGIAAAILAALGYVLRSTRSGIYFYAVGGNERGARFSGVNVALYMTLAYVASSALASVTGVLLTARVGSGEATLGTSMMMESIAAAILAGVSLKGGSGRLSMVVLSALFLSAISNGMNLIRVDSKYQIIVIGIIVILVVALENLNRARGIRA
jgi:ribose transport system permease protein